MSFTVHRVVPILRVFDLDKAREFYLGYLGCQQDWQHRFDGAGPVYQQVSRDGMVLHLSEHHGDGTPGQVVYLYASGVAELHAELLAKDYPYLNPGLAPGPCLTLLDPFGNTLRIDQTHLP